MTNSTPILTQTLSLKPEANDHPLTVTASVVSLERREGSGIFGHMVGLAARLNLILPNEHQPHSYFLSRLTDEPFWVQDAHFGPSSYPDFSHGIGARYLKQRGISTELETLLDQAARKLGLVKAIGPDVPLVLAVPGEPGDSTDAMSHD